MFCVRKRNVSGRRFFYAPKTYVFIDSNFKIVHKSTLFSESIVSKIEFEFEFLRFYCYVTVSGYSSEWRFHPGMVVSEDSDVSSNSSYSRLVLEKNKAVD